MFSKLLYLTYISLDKAPTSGSSVRPQKMRDVFKGLAIDVKIFDGISNNIKLRKQKVKEIKKTLKIWKPDGCYIEPPSGPFFYYGDVQLIKYLHKKGIPISIFYRDAYWKYPEYSIEKKESLKTKIKRYIVKCMQIWQWNVFKKNIDIIYFPSLSMAKEFDCPKKDILPPGAFVPEFKEKTELSKILQYIFVGGAAQNHGTFLTINAFNRLNENEIKAKLIYVCPEEQWLSLGINKELYKGWLEVIHTSGDENLKPLYEIADVALLTAPRTFYRDFAIPIKIFEYISYLKPMLVTDCTETARIVNENNIGWVTKDVEDSIVKQLEYLCSNPQEIIQIRQNMQSVREKNLWECRAQKVIQDLETLKQ